MKKITSMLLVLVLALSAFALTSCFDNTPEVDVNAKSEGVMTYAQYAAAELNSEVVIEAYVQDAQGWWAGKTGTGVITVYTADKDGAYFIYEMACSEADAAKLVPGTKIRVTGYKKAWSGEVEVMDGTFEFVNDGITYIAPAFDATSLLGTDDLINHQNQYVALNNLKVVAANENGDAFMYNWNGSGSRGSDIYFKVESNGQVYTLVIESYLRGQDTAVYQAAEALKVGDTINVKGFLYWYEGVQPHITSIEK